MSGFVTMVSSQEPGLRTTSGEVQEINIHCQRLQTPRLGGKKCKEDERVLLPESLMLKSHFPCQGQSTLVPRVFRSGRGNFVSPCFHLDLLTSLVGVHVWSSLTIMALPNLRRLFVEARTEAEENEYSRNAVRYAHTPPINHRSTQ